MKALSHPSAICLLLVVLTSCTAAAKPARPTPVVVPTDLAFSAPLVQLLSQSGLGILSVQRSVYESMFQSTSRAAWIQTDRGILDAVFFADPAEVPQIHVTQSPGGTADRYRYTIQALPSTLSHDQTIDAAFPLYFTMVRGMFLVTGSAELDRTLKRIFAGG